MEMPKVSFIINNYKRIKHLELCLNSLLGIEYPNYEIIVVDSCTPNFSNWMKKYLSVKYVHLDKYIGASQTRNIGFQKADPNSTYICFMDEDVFITPNCLSNLVQQMEDDQKIGAISPILMKYADKSQIDSLGQFMTHTGYQYKIPCNNENLAKLKVKKNMDIFYAETAIVLVRKNLLNQLSKSMEPFDGDYFVHWYDIDLSWRLWLMGFRIVISANSICYHDRGVSSGAWKSKPENIFLNSRNRLVTFLKYYEKSYLIKYFPIIMCLEFMRGFAVLSRRPDHARKIFKAIFWVLSHPFYVNKKRKKFRQSLIESNDKLKNIFTKTSISYLRKQFDHNYPVEKETKTIK